MIAEPASGMPLNHENERKFFHGVTVASVSDTQYSDGNQDYDMVSIVSGNRADPVGTEINDRAYLFRDYLIAPQTIELDGSNQPTNYPKCNNSDSEHQCHPSATSLEPLDEDDLVDVTDFVLTDRTDVGVVNAASTSEKDDLKKSEGWYVRLEYTGAGKGEKGFSSTTIADGVIYFTTYIPAEEEIVVGGGDQTCKVAIGESLLYAVNAYTGSPEFENWAGGDSSLETQDRVQFVGAGPSSQPFTMDLPDGSLVQRAGQTGVANAQQIDGTIPVKTYWFED
jgi:type IV pilus assembly protein PilY1